MRERRKMKEDESEKSVEVLAAKKDWSGLPCPSSGDLPDLEIEPRSPALQAESLLSESPGKP